MNTGGTFRFDTRFHSSGDDEEIEQFYIPASFAMVGMNQMGSWDFGMVLVISMCDEIAVQQLASQRFLDVQFRASQQP